ncbi:MAG TPA: DMT family transporter [Ignavibacteriales bacterium]|nr:DMT family transporter [Ignavibacteriales bacterium]HOL82193.1 DMT family transporter [Ignavibacteriales bacterium]HOM66309.1 DMT family transporter [Ignavibacteriales bacterium]HPD67994.1 DMT family transporter [Ignavibacteriales bacterium]HPP34428.1 DMT family transporter [Ignavibacteriales bacterium]
MKSKIEHYFAEIILFSTTLFWAGTFAIVKNSVKDSSPIIFVAIRFSLAALVMIPLIYKYFNEIKNYLKPGLILGITLCIGFILQTIGLAHTTATKSGFITGTLVVLTPFCEFFILKRKPSKGAITGVVFVFIGLILLSTKGNNVLHLLYELGNDFNFGDFLTLLGALAYSIYIVYIDIYTVNANVKILTFIQIVVTAVVAYLFAIIFDLINIEPISVNFTTSLILSFIYTAVFATVLTTFLQTKYQNKVTPTEAGIIYSFEPIFAAIISYIFLGEVLGLISYIGAGILVIGVIIAHLMPDKK